jgi:hypothetical protein
MLSFASIKDMIKCDICDSYDFRLLSEKSVAAHHIYIVTLVILQIIKLPEQSQITPGMASFIAAVDICRMTGHLFSREAVKPTDTIVCSVNNALYTRKTKATAID